MSNRGRVRGASIAIFSTALTFGAIGASASLAGAEVADSQTIQRQVAQCDEDVWSHMEQQALVSARTFCRERGGVDDKDVRFVHHDSTHGDREVCTLHLHYECQRELPGDARR